ncbi:MAG: hypothetical protein M5R36_27340 [Deltaproteobacteria bacterium]|nr:hypothetical protein [Deltaproteobacteria bacterium]
MSLFLAALAVLFFFAARRETAKSVLRTHQASLLVLGVYFLAGQGAWRLGHWALGLLCEDVLFVGKAWLLFVVGRFYGFELVDDPRSPEARMTPHALVMRELHIVASARKASIDFLFNQWRKPSFRLGIRRGPSPRHDPLRGDARAVFLRTDGRWDFSKPRSVAPDRRRPDARASIFPVFHGIGTVYLHYPFYRFGGRNLFSARLARYLLPGAHDVRGVVGRFSGVRF